MVEDALAVGVRRRLPRGVLRARRRSGLFEIDTAFSIAKWTGLGLIGFYGYWAARFAGASGTGACSRARSWRSSVPA